MCDQVAGASMRFGLDDPILADMCTILSRTQGVRRALIFGSRGRRDFAVASDIDLAIEAPDLSDVDFSNLCAALQAVPMIFRLDIVRLDDLKNAVLRTRIERDGVALLG